MFEKLDILFKIILTRNKLTFQMLTGNSPIHTHFDCAKWNIRSISIEFISFCVVMIVSNGLFAIIQQQGQIKIQPIPYVHFKF